MASLIVLGIDALDFNMVNELNLAALKQRQYNEIVVPLGSDGYPHSPSVWASFLIGKNVEVDFVVVEPGVNRFGGLSQETFVDWSGVKAINAPYYNHEVDTLSTLVDLQAKRAGYKDTRDTQSELISKMISTHLARTKEILEEVVKTKNNPHHKMVFAYIQTLDTMQHYFFPKPRIIENLYREMDVLVSDLKKQSGGTTLIIVSDHGFREGTHSHKGYYSCSHPLDNKPTNIINFFKVIEGFLH